MATGDALDRRKGILEDWNDSRGFGFIAPSTGGPRVFVHVSDLPRGRRPTSGCEVTYTPARDQRNRIRGTQVRYTRAGAAGQPHRRGTGVALVTAVLFFMLLTALLALHALPGIVVLAYGLLSGVAVLVYGADKSAAEQGTRRTAESTLHAIALVGGWPGALVARQVFRHKTIKQPFVATFWGTVVVNCGALGWLLYAGPEVFPSLTLP